MPVVEQVKRVQALSQAAQEHGDAGRYGEAAAALQQIIAGFPDLAITEYARLDHALLLYQLGDTSGAILELQDQEVAMRGSAEVHAALAAITYAERPSLLPFAEQQWEVACAFDKRYASPAWVQQHKHWPPRALAALSRFLSLS